jgi:hypothetical protein
MFTNDDWAMWLEGRPASETIQDSSIYPDASSVSPERDSTAGTQVQLAAQQACMHGWFGGRGLRGRHHADLIQCMTVPSTWTACT